jgi:hypothetical protein
MLAAACAPFLLLALVVLSAGHAGAVEVDFGLRGEVGYEDNVFGTAQNKRDDVVLRGQPSLRIREREGVVSWEFRYSPWFRYFVDHDEVSGWSHDVFGEAVWRITPALRLRVSERFSRVDSLGRFFEDVAEEGIPEAEAGDVPDFDLRTRRSKLNRLSGALTWDVSPTQTLTFQTSWSLNRFDREQRGDNDLLRAEVRYLQIVTERSSLGGGVSASQSEVDSITGGAASRSRFYNLFGSWQYALDPTTFLSVSAGPAWVRPERLGTPAAVVFEDRQRFPLRQEDGEIRFIAASSCPTREGVRVFGADCAAIPVALRPEEAAFFLSQRVDLELLGEIPSPASGSLTFFADATLTKRWERWLAQLSYRRQEATTSGLFGASTVADVVSASLTWQAALRWDIAFNAAWVRREQATELLTGAVQVAPRSILLDCETVGEVVPDTILRRGGCFPSSTVVVFPPFGEIPFPLGDEIPRPQTVSGVAQSVGVRTFTVKRDVESQQIFLGLSSRYRLSKNLRLVGNVSYSRQRFDADFLTRGTASRFRASVGIQYDFDTIHF